MCEKLNRRRRAARALEIPAREVVQRIIGWKRGTGGTGASIT